jgi:hypothetical protein
VTSNPDEYNGWANRETWACNLWLTNDQGLYELTMERVREAAPTDWRVLVTAGEAACTAGEAVRSLWDEVTDPEEHLLAAETIVTMVKDVGSDYRINWDEIGAAFLETIAEESAHD